MEFGEKLRIVRTDRGLTQEQLAEILSVSRQAVSKWESGVGYPETEKLLQISKELDVSLDYLLLDKDLLDEKKTQEPEQSQPLPQGRISITTFDGKRTVSCLSVHFDRDLSAGKDMPTYILSGVQHVSFWGEHTVILAYYETEESAKKEVSAIMQAMSEGKGTYSLQYQSEVEISGFFGRPKLKKDS